MQARNRSICEMAYEVQASGLCVPDWLGEHCKDADIYDRMRNLPAYAGWERLCREIEHKRHFLFDELPNCTTMSAWTDPAAALQDYARRVNQPELPAKVQQLWN